MIIPMKTLPHCFVAIVLLVALTPVCQLSAQEFTVDMEIRPRLEIRNGFKTPILEGQDPAAFVEQRSRVALNFSDAPVSMRLVMQDVRIWGNHSQIYKTDANLSNVYEAWARYRFNPELMMQFGRMQLDYDNARFMGNLDWAMQGRSHDAFLVRHNNARLRLIVDAAATWNQAGITESGHLTGNFYPLGAANNKTMQFLWVNKQYDEAAVSVLLHNDGRQLANESMAWLQTFGTYMRYQFGDYHLQTDAYYQTGEDAAGNDASAYFLGFDSRRQLDNFALSVGLDLSSGTESGSVENNSFMPLYGTNHKFYGFMDYFQVGNPFRQPTGGFDVGFKNVYQKLTWNALEELSLALHLHEFIAHRKVVDAVTGDILDPYLGTELDFMVTWHQAPSASFMAGYSVMLQTDTMNAIKGAVSPKPHQSWAFVMLRISPRVFSSGI